MCATVCTLHIALAASKAPRASAAGCLHRGHVPLAREVFEKMKSWQIVPDDTSLRLMAQLLSQGLCFKELKSLAHLDETDGKPEIRHA